jgi:hypothetical protein
MNKDSKKAMEFLDLQQEFRLITTAELAFQLRDKPWKSVTKLNDLYHKRSLWAKSKGFCKRDGDLLFFSFLMADKNGLLKDYGDSFKDCGFDAEIFNQKHSNY